MRLVTGAPKHGQKWWRNEGVFSPRYVLKNERRRLLTDDVAFEGRHKYLPVVQNVERISRRRGRGKNAKVELLLKDRVPG